MLSKQYVRAQTEIQVNIGRYSARPCQAFSNAVWVGSSSRDKNCSCTFRPWQWSQGLRHKLGCNIPATNSGERVGTQKSWGLNSKTAASSCPCLGSVVRDGRKVKVRTRDFETLPWFRNFIVSSKVTAAGLFVCPSMLQSAPITPSDQTWHTGCFENQ